MIKPFIFPLNLSPNTHLEEAILAVGGVDDLADFEALEPHHDRPVVFELWLRHPKPEKKILVQKKSTLG